ARAHPLEGAGDFAIEHDFEMVRRFLMKLSELVFENRLGQLVRLRQAERAVGVGEMIAGELMEVVGMVGAGLCGVTPDAIPPCCARYHQHQSLPSAMSSSSYARLRASSLTERA